MIIFDGLTLYSGSTSASITVSGDDEIAVQSLNVAAGIKVLNGLYARGSIDLGTASIAATAINWGGATPSFTDLTVTNFTVSNSATIANATITNNLTTKGLLFAEGAPSVNLPANSSVDGVPIASLSTNIEVPYYCYIDVDENNYKDRIIFMIMGDPEDTTNYTIEASINGLRSATRTNCKVNELYGFSPNTGGAGVDRFEVNISTSSWNQSISIDHRDGARASAGWRGYITKLVNNNQSYKTFTSSMFHKYGPMLEFDESGLYPIGTLPLDYPNYVSRLVDDSNDVQSIMGDDICYLQYLIEANAIRDSLNYNALVYINSNNSAPMLPSQFINAQSVVPPLTISTLVLAKAKTSS